MAYESEYFPTKIIDKTNKLQQSLADTYLSYTEIGELLNKNKDVVSQYAKAGIIHPIQQGPRKMVKLKEVYLLDTCMYAVEHYGCSYTACKIIAELLKETCTSPEEYKECIKKMETRAKITKEEVSKYVNSYRNRGIFQKQKAAESRKNIQIRSECCTSNRF
jgi:hypothetical protein